MAWALVVVGSAAAIKAGADIYSANKASNRAEDAANKAQIEENTKEAQLKKEMDAYKSHKFENPYANMQNVYKGMENTYEDVTVNQQQAQFEAQQGMQQRADIMQNLQGAAGGSGIAALAQSMANQGQLQTQQISASIGAQESKIQRLRAGEAGRLQTLERQGEGQVQAGRIKGDIMVQDAEMSRQKTLLGMAQGEARAAAAASNRADAIQMQADNALTSAWAGGIGDVVGSLAGPISGGLSAGGGITGADALAQYGGAGLTDSGGYIGHGDMEELTDVYTP